MHNTRGNFFKHLCGVERGTFTIGQRGSYEQWQIYKENDLGIPETFTAALNFKK